MHNEILKNHYSSLLLKMINEKGGHASRIEDIFDNLPLLAKKIAHFGEETMYLDLNMKKMLTKALDPGSRIVYKVVERTNVTIAVEAFFYWGGDEHYSGYGYSKKSLENIVRNDFNLANIELNFEALVKGAAASRALTDAGIGLEFYCDEFDDLLKALEKSEAIDVMERNEQSKKETMEKLVPTVPSMNEQKRHRATKKAETDPFDPREVICDYKEFSGQKLGTIWDNNPRILVKLARDSSLSCSLAAKALVKTNEELSKYLED